MDNKLYITFGLFLLCFLLSDAVTVKRKSLKLVLDKWDKVKEAEHILKTNLTFVKLDDKKVKINGQVEQLVDLNDEYKSFELLIRKDSKSFQCRFQLNITTCYSRLKDGKYRKFLVNENLGICNVRGIFSDAVYKSLTNYVNIPDHSTCPLRKKTFVIKDYHLDSSKFQRFLRPGFYKTVISLIHKDKEVLQYKVDSHTEEE